MTVLCGTSAVNWAEKPDPKYLYFTQGMQDAKTTAKSKGNFIIDASTYIDKHPEHYTKTRGKVEGQDVPDIHMINQTGSIKGAQQIMTESAFVQKFITRTQRQYSTMEYKKCYDAAGQEKPDTFSKENVNHSRESWQATCTKFNTYIERMLDLENFRREKMAPLAIGLDNWAAKPCLVVNNKVFEELRKIADSRQNLETASTGNKFATDLF